MKRIKRGLSLLLVLCLCVSMMPVPVSAARSTGEIVKAALELLYYNEGTYGSVNANDNGAVSVGKIQWHGNRALNLLKTIVNMDRNQARTILGEALYNEIISSTNWSTRTVNSTEKNAISVLLVTSNGKTAQDNLATNDVTAYINHGQNLGIKDDAALVYFADLENQGGAGMSRNVAGAAASAMGSYGNITLQAIHNAALSDSKAGKYPSRRNRTFTYCQNLKWDTAPTSLDIGTNFYAYIINTGHWKHLTNDGNNVSMRSETGAPNQVWYFERQNDLSYKITSMADGNCMEVWNFGTTDGTNVQTYPYNGNTAQLWHISGTSGAYVFRAKCASTVLDVNGNSSEEGTNVQMWTYNGSGAQLFQVWKLDDYDTSAPSSPAVNLSNSSYGMKNGNYLKDSENVTISWSANNGDSYRIRIKYSADSSYLVDRDVGGNTSFTYSPTKEGKYTVYVCASNEAGSSSWVSRDFYIRGLYGKHWVSDSSTGDTVTSFQSGDRVYFNYKIYDKATGDLFFTYYDSDYPVTLAIIDPNGNIVASRSYTRDDNDYISYVCTNPGTYTAKVTFNSLIYTKEFTVNASSYTISYNANGGTGAPGSQTKQYGVPLTLSSTVPTGKSYTVTFNGNGGTVSQSSKRVYQQFNGWNTKSNGSGDAYSAGETYSADASCTLYAQWDAATLGSVTDPVRDGYHFLGWYESTATNSDGFPIGYPCSSMKAIDSNTTLYAMWSAANVLYYGDVDRDGSVTTSDVSYINQYLRGQRSPDYSIGEFLLRSDLDRDGEITNDDLSVVNALRLNQITQKKLSEAYKTTTVSTYPKKSYNYGENLNTTGLSIDILFDTGISYTISDELRVSGYDPKKTGMQTLTVQYHQFTATYTIEVAPQAYTISYNANGGSGAPGNQVKKHGVDLTLSSVIPTRFGYNFQGWSVGSTATTASYLPGSNFAANANTTLYAVWTSAADISEDVTSSNYNASITFANGYQYFAFTPSFTGKVRLESAGSGDPQVYLYDAKGNQIASDDDDGSGNNFLLTQAVTAGTNYYAKVKYYGSATGTISFSVKRAYEIIYDANGGVGSPDTQTKLYDDALTLSTDSPTRANYNFIGWATHKSATNASYQPGSNFADNADTTLYAVWTPENFVLTYDANGGIGAPSSQNSPYGVVLTVSSTIPTRFGYTFLGWSTTASDTSATCFPGGSLTLGGDATLYAIWKSALTIDSYVSNRDYDVTIPFANGCAFYVFTPAPKRFQFESAGDGDMQIYLYDANGTLLANDDDSGNNLNFLLNYTFVSGNTYYVKVQYYGSGCGSFTFNLARAYDITYDANGGTEAPAAQVKTHDVRINLSTDIPSRSGYDFVGWATVPNATSASYQPGDSYTANDNLSLYAVWSSNCDNGHSYSYAVTRAPTASATGTLTGTCSRCSGTTTVTLPKLDTTNYTYKVTKEPTCTAAGTGRYTWKTTTYGSFYFDVSIAAKGHTYTSKVTAPTCTEQGYTTHTCACGHSYKDNYTAATGHSYTYKATKAPTTSATGTLTGTCSKCSGTTTVTLPKLDTTNYTYKVTKEPTCTATGTGRYTWKTTTYGSFYFDVSIAAKGHSYTSTVTAPTCTAQGYTTYTCACGHSYKDSYTNATGHSYSYTVTKTPTTSATGTLTGTCSKCSGTTTVTLPKLNTTDYTYKVTKEPTCTATGTGRYTWKTTTYGSFYFDVSIAAKGHSYTSKVTAPTCTAQGYTTYTCACGHSYKDSYTPATGHSYSYKVTKAPTTSATGTLTGTCSKCSGTTTVTLPKLDTTNYTYKVTKEPTCTATGTGRYTWKTTTYGSFYFDVSIAAKGHTYTSTVTAPTCTAQGYTTYTCACGHSYKDNYTNATGHSYTYKATKAPTTSATGTLTGTCSKCSGTTTVTLPKLDTTNYTYKVTKEPTCTATGTGRYTWKTTTYGSFYFDVSIAAKGHTYTSKVTAPTCTDQGYTTYTCACGHSYKDSYTAATGHSYSYKVTKAPTTSAAGTLTGTCSRCSGTTTVTLPKLDTTNYTYKVTKEPTCTATGTGRYTWKTTTYGSFYFDVSIAAKGHTYTSKVTAPTCTEQGYTTHTCACGHSYKDNYTNATGHSCTYKATKAPSTSATGTLTGTCSKCNGTTTVTLPKLNTTDYTYKVTKEPTCTATGTGRYTWKTTTYGNFYFDVSIAAKGHSYTSTVTAPTCTAQGYTTYTCACGHSYKDSYTPATGHSYSYKATKAPTTSATGTLTGTCSKCSGTTTVTLPKLDTTNYTYKVTKEPTCTATGTGRYTWKTTTYGSFYFDVSIAAKGHTYTSKVTAPTCTAQGYTTHTCQCGHSFVDSYVNALGHDMGKWTVVNAATCTKAGSERRDCSRCDHYETRNVSATGHSYEPHVTAPTCTVGGYTQYICAACGSSYTSDYTDATGHDHKAKVTAATCTSQGYTTYTCHCGDSYVSDYTNALGHDMGDWITVTEATCAENGQQIQKCSRCDHNKTRTTEALGHAWDDGIMTIEPTEDTEGKMIYTCERCGLTRTEVIPALDHEHRYDAIVTAPTCTQKGYTTHTCDCGHSFVDTYVDALGHDMGRWFTISDATCTEDGLEQRDCSRCDYCETRENSASGHTYESMSTAPTCTNMGFTTHTCHCGDSYTDSYIDPLGHSFTVYASDGNATCTQDGTKTAVCDRCDIKDTVIDEGSARGHDFTEWTVIQKPTVTSEGLEFRYCLICGIGETRHVAWSENPFTDVPEGSFYYEPVLWAVENGITNGATATTFNPNGTCLRAHVVTFLHRADGNPEPTSAKNPFEDVKYSDFFYKPVLWAVEKGITNGTTATTFGSYANCNRAAVVTFLWRAAGSPEPESTSNPFVDVKPTDYFYKPVLWAAENSITSGIDATHFGPTADCNRAQVVTFLYRAYN